MDETLLKKKITLPLLDLKEMFKYKTVSVVGNAESIFSYQFGNEIDSNEIVIRMNKGYIRNTEAQGTRTSIWASSYPLKETEVYKFFTPDVCMWMTPKLAIMPEYSDGFLKNTFIHPEEIWNNLYIRLDNTRPTTGLMVINFLINYTEAKSVTLFGFDFFKTKTFYEPKLRKNTPHCFSLEEQLVSSIIDVDSRLTIKGNNAFSGNNKKVFITKFMDFFKKR